MMEEKTEEEKIEEKIREQEFNRRLEEKKKEEETIQEQAKKLLADREKMTIEEIDSEEAIKALEEAKKNLLIE